MGDAEHYRETRAKLFLSRWAEHCRPEVRDDQQALELAWTNGRFDIEFTHLYSYSNSSVNIEILDCRRFPSGFEIRHRAADDAINDSIQLIHANFMGGLKKKAFL